MTAHPYNEHNLPTDDEALAILDLAMLPELEAPPESLASRLAVAASAFTVARSAPQALPAREAPADSPSLLRIVPWFIAAAALIALAVPSLIQAPSQDPTAGVLALFDSSAPADTIRLAWVEGGDATAAGVTGEVVWSDSENAGYMRFAGLKVNDPAVEQYQLWIFDAERPDGDLPQFGEGLLTQRPVDGGVFDITESGEVIIPIDAKLAVSRAAVFAVTVEPPGGVVVSDRSRVATLALPQG